MQLLLLHRDGLNQVMLFLLSLYLALTHALIPPSPIPQNLTGSDGAGPSSPRRPPSPSPEGDALLCVDPVKYPAWSIPRESRPLEWDDCRRAWEPLSLRLIPQSRAPALTWTFWSRNRPPNARFPLRTLVEEIYGMFVPLSENLELLQERSYADMLWFSLLLLRDLPCLPTPPPSNPLRSTPGHPPPQPTHRQRAGQAG